MKTIKTIAPFQYDVNNVIYRKMPFVGDDVERMMDFSIKRISIEVDRSAYNHKYMELSLRKKDELEAEIKLLLHAQRDCFRNQGKDATKISGFSCRDGYYCDCVGILRALQIFGYGEFGAINAEPEEPPNLSSWLYRLEHEVMEEEGFHSDNRCEWCLKKYGKDDKSEREKRQRDTQT